MITELTPEQEALIPVYREKWRAIALSTERIDREKATEAVKAAYAEVRAQPDVIFLNSPREASKTIPTSPMWGEVIDLWRPLWVQMSVQLKDQLYRQLRRRLKDQLWVQLYAPLWGHNKFLDYCFQDHLSVCSASFLGFCIDVLNCNYDEKRWNMFQSLIKSCGWFLPYKEKCFVGDRPIKFSFDNQQRLHAEGEPAILYSDGYSFYGYHGVTLPEKYGRLHPNEWQARWLLEENNAELRRVLIQGIGYARICQELDADELDTWQEYTLLRIDADIDGLETAEFEDFEGDEDAPRKEPVHILKMTCPSTGFTHALRVPPDITSAREAIRWVNWGIDPEEFSIQT